MKLIRRHERVIDEFQRRCINLFSVERNVQQKLDQIPDFREDISAVTNLQQSIDNFQQNDRSLPKARIARRQGDKFVVALFSVNEGIFPNEGGLSLFIGLIILFFVVTYGLAFSLDGLIKGLDSIPERFHHTQFVLYDYVRTLYGDLNKWRSERQQERETRKGKNHAFQGLESSEMVESEA
ncbi:hypothetical protein MMC18_004018 [Xylographa bjoerkii]|nr:hypothetical protein [Xylographa bjoerkii]